MKSGIFAHAAAASATIFAVPALAQDSADATIISLSEASETPESAIETARQQEESGDPLGAAATLERALLDNENADDVRLKYVAVLCRLDDRQSARIELQALRGRPTGKPAWNDMVEACGSEFDRNVRHTSKLNGRVAIGLAYDEDAFGALLGGFSDFGPPSRDGLGFKATAQLNGRTEIGAGFLYADAWGQLRTDLSGPEFDYQIGEIAFGFGHEAHGMEVAAGPVVRHGRIGGNRLATEYGGQFRLAFRSGASNRVSLVGEAVDEDYAGSFLDGRHYDLALTLEGHPTRNKSFFLGIAGEIKTAESEPAGYKALRLMAAMEVPLGTQGTYMNLSSTFRYVDYENVKFYDPGKEWRVYNRLAVGVPLSAPHLFAEVAASHSRRNYNKASFGTDYDSLGGEFRLVYRF